VSYITDIVQNTNHAKTTLHAPVILEATMYAIVPMITLAKTAQKSLFHAAQIRVITVAHVQIYTAISLQHLAASAQTNILAEHVKYTLIHARITLLKMSGKEAIS